MTQINKPKIAIVFYSTYSHIYKLALAIKEGADKSGVADVSLYQIPETLPKEVLAKMGAPEKPHIPIITPDILSEADGILFGIPTRFGTIPAQVKDFIDSCGGLWATGGLSGKLAGVFVSSNGQHSGQETTFLNFMSTLVHFGMIYVPFGYASAHLQEDQEIIGGSPWGSSIVAGKSGKEPSEKELEMGQTQGENFANYLAKYNGYSYQQSFLAAKEASADKKALQTPVTVDTIKSERSTSPKRKSTFKTFFEKLISNN